MSTEPSFSSVKIEVTDLDGNVSSVSAERCEDVIFNIRPVQESLSLADLNAPVLLPNAYDLAVTFRAFKNADGVIYRIVRPTFPEVPHE